MGDQLVSVDSPVEEGGGKAPFTKIFWSCLPYYLQIGMTEDNYFHGDPALCKAYRDAWNGKVKYQEELINWSAWLMGGYVYQTMCLVAPTYNSLKPQRPGNYPTEPLGLHGEQKSEDTTKDFLMRWAAKVNSKYGRHS